MHTSRPNPRSAPKFEKNDYFKKTTKIIFITTLISGTASCKVGRVGVGRGAPIQQGFGHGWPLCHLPRKFSVSSIWNGMLSCIPSGIFAETCLQDAATITPYSLAKYLRFPRSCVYRPTGRVWGIIHEKISTRNFAIANRSRASCAHKVTIIGPNFTTRSCYHSNYDPILYCFPDTARYW